MECTALAIATTAVDDASPARLSEEAAWEIAMTWQAQLQGRIGLAVDRHGPIRSILESYAWVRLVRSRQLSQEQDEESCRLEEVSITRAVMISWSALAACPGFSGSENAAFWKRVIRALQIRGSDQSAVRNRLPPVTDAYGFFDLPGHVFPRFMVEIPTMFDCVGGEWVSPQLEPAINSTLQSLLERLAPYTRNVPHQPIDICLSILTLSIEVEKDNLPVLVYTTNASSRFNICQIQVQLQTSISSESKMKLIHKLLRELPLSFAQVRLQPLFFYESQAVKAMFCQAFLRLAGSEVSATIPSLEISRDTMDDDLFQAFCSALPFATSLHTLAFEMLFVNEQQSELFDLPWIAYAMFHPHSESSSWRHLTLETAPLTPHSTYVLAAMMRGNNLLPLLKGTPLNSDAYYSAEVPCGTLIQREPNTESAVLLEVSLPATAVDVCGIASLDRTTWGEWVAVVVPAYGLGWVRATELDNVRARAAARPSLTGLHLRLKRVRASSSHLLRLLPLLGSSLIYLKISSVESVSLTSLRRILHSCPSLKVLVVKHDGRIWSESNPKEIAPSGTQLEEVALIFRSSRSYLKTPTYGHIVTSLRNLRVLRVKARTADQLHVSQSALEQLLYHAVLLRLLHWQRPNTDLIRGAARRDSTKMKLEQLRLTHSKYLYAQLPLSPACAIAFLSVVAHADQSGWSALGDLVDRGVLMIIFLFATTPLRRSIHIEELEGEGEAPVADNEQLQAPS